MQRQVPVPMSQLNKFFWSLLTAGEKRTFAGLTLASILSTGVIIALPLVSAKIINALVYRDMSLIMKYVWWLVACGVGALILSFFTGFLSALINHATGLRLRRRLFAGILSRRPEFFRGHQTGDTISRLVNDSKVVESYLSAVVLRLIVDQVMLLAVFVILFRMEWRLALPTVILFPISFLLIHQQRRKVEQREGAIRKHWGRLSTVTENWLSRVLQVKSKGLEKPALSRFDEANDSLWRESMGLAKLQAMLGMVAGGLGFIPSILILGWGSYLAVDGALTVGGLIAFMQYAGYFSAPIDRLMRLKITLPTLMPSYLRLREFEEFEPESGLSTVTQTEVTALKARDVVYRYPGERGFELRLDGFTAKRGELIGIRGGNGAGKSTLIQLVHGLLEPQCGAWLINGTPHPHPSSVLRRGTFCLFQDFAVFPGTIADNIALFRSQVEESEMREIIERVGLTRWLSQKDHGLQEVLNPASAEGSGGELQKLNFAALLYNRKSVLLLDEPDKNLDVEGKAFLAEILQNLKKDRMVIIVSHDPTLLAGCDRIYDMQRESDHAALVQQPSEVLV